MSRKTIFLSAVSRELEDIRKLLDTAFSRHFDVITQERSLNQHPGHGIREVLVDAVDSADCMIHLAGRGFGGTADVPFPEHPDFVCSWTQFEYYHAHLQGKPVFALICGPSLADPAFVETADTTLGVDEKTRLQHAHCARVVTGRFDDTPFTTLPRTANNRQEKASREELLEAAISICAQMAATDPAYARVQAELQDMRAALGRIEKTQKHLLRNSALTLAALALLGGGVWLLLRQQGKTDARVASTHQQIDQLDQKVEARFTKERRYMALILARSSERLKDWESMPPGQRFDLALDEIASEQKIPATELRALLDLYVSLVEAEPNPDAEDLYYVQMRKLAFAEAAKTASTEAEAAVSRMEAAETKSQAAQTLADIEKEKAATERKRAIDFFEKEANAHFTAGDYRKALVAFEKSASLIDKATDSLDWCEAQDSVAICLLHLADHARAEPLIKEILALRENQLPPEALVIATALNNLAALYQATNRLKEAEPLMERVVNIFEKAYAKDHPDVATALNNLALLYQATNRLKESEPLMERALRIDEKVYGKDHPNAARDLNNLAQLYQATNRLKEAESLMERVVDIFEKAYGKDHPKVATSLNNLAALYQATNRLKEAEPLLERAQRIDEQSYGKDHPNVARALNNLAQLYQATNRLKESEPLMERVLDIFENAYGKDHPKVATSLNNLAQLYRATNRLKEAEPFMERALRIDEQAYGKDHPNVAIRLNNLAQLYRATNRLKEAEPLSRRATIIFLKFSRSTKHQHPHLTVSLEVYNGILTASQLPKETILEKMVSLGPEAEWDAAEWKRELTELISASASLANRRSAEAMDAYRKGDHAAALKLWQAALNMEQAEAKPDAGNMRITRMNIASSQISLGEHDAAREELKAIIRELDAETPRDCFSARARHHLARALVGLDDKPAAITTLREALAIYKEATADKFPPAHLKESEDLLKELTK